MKIRSIHCLSMCKYIRITYYFLAHEFIPNTNFEMMLMLLLDADMLDQTHKGSLTTTELIGARPWSVTKELYTEVLMAEGPQSSRIT
jgi:hypothetical protein